MGCSYGKIRWDIIGVRALSRTGSFPVIESRQAGLAQERWLEGDVDIMVHRMEAWLAFLARFK